MLRGMGWFTVLILLFCCTGRANEKNLLAKSASKVPVAPIQPLSSQYPIGATSGLLTKVYTFKAAHLPQTNLPSSLALGTAISPAGDSLGATNFYFTWNKKPWIPFVAEFHYARTPIHEWESALKKIKAAGVNVVSTYCFWIHHEELQGEWDWNARRNLRKFVQLCAQYGLFVYLRIGPYCHGEVRNGGLPNWVMQKYRIRSTDPAFLELVHQWYAQLYLQVKGLLFSQGGPIIGVQLDNEYIEHTNYLQQLKQLAVQEGFDVPYYSVTAWDQIRVPHSLLPVWGCYPDAPWKPGTHRLDPAYEYLFTGALGNPYLETADYAELKNRGLWLPRGVPYAAMEVGGGNQITFRRRPLFEKADIDALAVTMLGRGTNLLGIYMFHGGSNPIGRVSPLHEFGYPKISYDFQAPLGEFGQPQAWYHSLRNLAAFLDNFGSLLAPAFPFLPDHAAKDPKDVTLLRCALRASSQSAFLFFHNHPRGQQTHSLGPIQFDIILPIRKLLLPPIIIPKDAVGIWPLNLDFKGVRLAWATAQPLYLLERGDSIYCFLKEIPGIAPEIALDAQTVHSAESPTGINIRKIRNSQFLVTRPQSGMDIALSVMSKDARHVYFIILSAEQAEKSWQARVWGQKRILISNADFLTWSPTEVRAFRSGSPSVFLSIFPPGGTGLSYERRADGIFRTSLLQTTPISVPSSVQTLTPKRWSIHAVRDSSDQCADVLLRIAYVGNVASLSVRGKVVADNFYNGRIWEISLRRFFSEPLELTITPLKRNTPIYLPQWPEIPGKEVLDLKYVEALPLYEFRFH